MSSIEQGDTLYPELVVEADGTEWVQITDGYGFCGYDPTGPQIAEALFGDRKDLTPADAVRFGQIALNTRRMYKHLVDEGYAEIIANLPWVKRNEDVKQAYEAYGKFKLFFTGEQYRPLNLQRLTENEGNEA